MCPRAIGQGLVKSTGYDALSGQTSRYTSCEGFAIIDALVSFSQNSKVLLDLFCPLKLFLFFINIFSF